MPDQVNPQIVESVALTNELVISNAPMQSQAFSSESLAYSLSLFMLNAVSTEYSAAQIANASVATTCAEILKAAASAGGV
jgi:Killing trait